MWWTFLWPHAIYHILTVEGVALCASNSPPVPSAGLQSSNTSANMSKTNAQRLWLLHVCVFYFFCFFLSLTPKGMSPAALSPALQRLVNRSSRKYTDKALRASYTPSPSHRASGSKTPLSPSHSLHTPTPGKTRTPASHDPASITDNLLQLPKRRTASDFFWGHKGHQTHTNFLLLWISGLCLQRFIAFKTSWLLHQLKV